MSQAVVWLSFRPIPTDFLANLGFFSYRLVVVRSSSIELTRGKGEDVGV